MEFKSITSTSDRVVVGLRKRSNRNNWSAAFGLGLGNVGLKVLFIILIVVLSVELGECGKRSKSKTRDQLINDQFSKRNGNNNLTSEIDGSARSSLGHLDVHSPLLPLTSLPYVPVSSTQAPSPPRQGSVQKQGQVKGRRTSRDEVTSTTTTSSGHKNTFIYNGTQQGKSSAGKNGQAKQSWLAVASAVAHSAAAETNLQQLPMTGDDSKPTKYHYYPHNQHLYLLPECATQQVCSAVYLRLNYSQPLCACPNFHEPCSVSTRTDDRHTIPLVTGSHSQALTLVKTCEPTQEVRECRAPKDWSILALQNSRTGKAHYLVICRCPSPGFLEGPIAHSQPAYARVPGIRVYGMTCVRTTSNRTGRLMDNNLTSDGKDEGQRGTNPAFPWNRLKALFHAAAGLNS